MKSSDVIVGIIFKGGRFLAEMRKQDEKIDPGIVCLPGGHVEREEDKEEAVVREMKEELNIDVKEMRFVKQDEWVASNGEKQKLFYYHILKYEGKPICKAAKRLLWIKDVKQLNTQVDRDAIKSVGGI